MKADPWAIIPTCRAMQGTVSSSSITLVLFTLCQMEFEFQLFKNTTLTPRIRRRFRFGDQKLILSTLTALTLIPKKFSVYWNSSDRVFSAKEQSKVLSSALRITSMNSRETHIFFLARARCLSAGLRYLRLTRLPRHDRGPVPGGYRSAASCLCTVLRRALYHYAARSPSRETHISLAESFSDSDWSGEQTPSSINFSWHASFVWCIHVWIQPYPGSLAFLLVKVNFMVWFQHWPMACFFDVVQSLLQGPPLNTTC